MGVLIWEKKRNKAIQWRWIFSFFLFCLFVSCFQAWVDEHHNSEKLISEKLDLSKQEGFWQGQSFAKDEAIRSRDQLVFQGLQTLTGTQRTENQTQKSLTDLSAKLFEVTKLEPIRISSKAMGVQSTNAPPGSPTAGILVSNTNRRINSFAGRIRCDTPFIVQQVQMLQGVTSLGPAYRQLPTQRELDLNFSNGAWDAEQPIVAILVGQSLDVTKCAITQQ